MNSREWFCLALRVLGVWQLMSSIEHAAWATYSLTSQGPVLAAMTLWALGGAASLTAGMLVLLFAPAIAERFYPAAADEPEVDPVAIVDAFMVGSRVLGVYALLLAMQGLGGVLAGFALQFLRFGFPGGIATSDAYSLARGVMMLAFAYVLLFGHERAFAFLSRLRYVAERDAYQPPSVEE